jgi:hypothetical protein
MRAGAHKDADARPTACNDFQVLIGHDAAMHLYCQTYRTCTATRAARRD